MIDVADVDSKSNGPLRPSESAAAVCRRVRALQSAAASGLPLPGSQLGLEGCMFLLAPRESRADRVAVLLQLVHAHALRRAGCDAEQECWHCAQWAARACVSVHVHDNLT